MSQVKTFKVAGYSTLNGVRKVRLAKDMKRAMLLERNGHTDVILNELPSEMTKEQCMEWLSTASVEFKESVTVDDVEAVIEQPAEQEIAVAVEQETLGMTLEEALLQIPLREKGRFIAKDIRIARAQDLMFG